MWGLFVIVAEAGGHPIRSGFSLTKPGELVTQEPIGIECSDGAQWYAAVHQADTALRWTMARHRLYMGAGRFHWDGAEHPTETEGGWYVANPDRTGAMFGSRSTGLVVHYRTTLWAPLPDNAEVVYSEYAEKRKPHLARAAADARKVWINAVPATDHPHLESRKLDRRLQQLRVTTETCLGDEGVVPAGLLVVPMAIDGKVVNLQFIDEEGHKHYWPGAPVIGTYLVSGQGLFNARTNSTIYLCEDWESASIIAQTAQCAAFACFCAEGLLPVARAIIEHNPSASLVIGATSDLRGKFLKGHAHNYESHPNPNVLYAREAAEAVGAKLVIPNFKDVAGKPRTFSDLLLREGPETVERWLDPERAHEAVTEDPNDERVLAKLTWQEGAPFTVLGYDRGTFYYRTEEVGQIMRFALSSHTPPNLRVLCDDQEWWRRYWELEGDVDWESAASALRNECKRTVFDQKIRGRGAHRDEGGVVFHAGGGLLPPAADAYIEPQSYREGRGVYERLPAVEGPDLADPMTLREAQELLDIFENTLPWQHSCSGVLAGGFAALAPFCGMLEHGRPHVYVLSPDVAGKAIVLEFFQRLLGGLGCRLNGVNEAGARQAIGSDARPVLYDVTAKGKKSQDRTEDVIRLATGQAPPSVPSMFLIASREAKSPLLDWEIESGRMALLKLRETPVLTRAARKLRGSVHRTIASVPADAGPRLMGRLLAFIRSGHFNDALAVSREALTELRRDADNESRAHLVAAAWLLQSDDVPDFTAMREWLRQCGFASYVNDAVLDGRHILLSLVQQEIPVVTIRGDVVTATIGDLLEIVAAEAADFRIGRGPADRTLQERGLRVIDRDLYVANGSEFVTKRLRRTPFEDKWTEHLRTIDGVRASKNAMRFRGRKRVRATVVPLSLVGRYCSLDRAS